METFLSSLNNGELNAIKRELSNSRSILQPKFLIISKPDILPSLPPSFPKIGFKANPRLRREKSGGAKGKRNYFETSEL